MRQSDIIQDLIARTESNIEVAEGFKNLDLETLSKNPDKDSWNILQCIEHLNRYSDFYLQEFKKRLQKPSLRMGNDYKIGYWGKLFTNGMLPDENIKTMNTFKSKNPIKDKVDVEVISTFIQQQKEFIRLLNKANEADLNKNNCSITIPLIKMRLGDTLQFYTFHNVRHVVQAQKVLGKI